MNAATGFAFGMSLFLIVPLLLIALLMLRGADWRWRYLSRGERAGLGLIVLLSAVGLGTIWIPGFYLAAVVLLVLSLLWLLFPIRIVR